MLTVTKNRVNFELRGGMARVDEGAALEMRCILTGYREFESPSLRHQYHEDKLRDILFYENRQKRYTK